MEAQDTEAIMHTPTVINISEYRIAAGPEAILCTFSLGSCLGVTVFDPVTRLGGLVHCLLPTSRIAPAKAQTAPGMFVNTGVGALLTGLWDAGACTEHLVIKAAGGANMRGDNLFNTGQRNCEALARLLEKNGLTLAASDMGGSVPRSLFLSLGTGRVVVRTLGQEREL